MSIQAPEAQAIDRTREAHVAALNAGDIDAWVGMFTDDGVQMPPNAPANVGRDAIRAWSAGFLGVFDAAFSLAPEEVLMTGPEWALERGTYEIELTPKAGGDAIRDSGKYLTVYQRRSGDGWAMARDIWNSSLPLPGMPE